MRKTIATTVLALGLVFAGMTTASATPAPEPCDMLTAPGTICVMPYQEGNAQVSEYQQMVAARDAEIAALSKQYEVLHQKWEIRGGIIEGYKDQVRWDRHEIRRLRAKLAQTH